MPRIRGAYPCGWNRTAPTGKMPVLPREKRRFWDILERKLLILRISDGRMGATDTRSLSVRGEEDVRRHRGTFETQIEIAKSNFRKNVAEGVVSEANGARENFRFITVFAGSASLHPLLRFGKRFLATGIYQNVGQFSEEETRCGFGDMLERKLLKLHVSVGGGFETRPYEKPPSHVSAEYSDYRANCYHY